MRSLLCTTLSLIVVSALSVPLEPRQTVANCDLEACTIDILSSPGAAATCAEGDPTASASCLITTFTDCTGCDPTGLVTYLTGLIPAGATAA